MTARLIRILVQHACPIKAANYRQKRTTCEKWLYIISFAIWAKTERDFVIGTCTHIPEIAGRATFTLFMIF